MCYKLWVHEFVPSIAIHIIIIYTNKVLTNCSILLLVIFFFGGVCKWTSISVEYVFFLCICLLTNDGSSWGTLFTFYFVKKAG